MNNTAIPVNTRQLFSRIIEVIKSNEHLSEYLQYELSPRPLPLFDDFGLRKTTKSALFDVLETLGEVEANSCDGVIYVIDGGFLLHRVVWPQNCTFADVLVLTAYETYITRHYGEIATVMFDEYNSDCTKGMERVRRSVKLHSPTVMFTSSTPVVTSQEKFLANLNNKSAFIKILSNHLTAAGINVLQASGDANTQIVHTAIELSHTQSYPVSVVGEDIDLLVLFATLAREERDVTFIKPGRVPLKVFSSRKLQHNLGDMKTHLLFLRAVTGCDTISAPYRQGKKKAYHMLKKRKDLQEQVSIFYHENVTSEVVSAAGE